MPMAIVPLPDVYETIIRKVAVDAIRQIGINMNIPQTAKVYLPGRTDSVPMNDGTFGNCCDSADKVYFDPEERITISYEEIADENFSLATSVFNNDNYPILVNENQCIEIYPISRYVDFRIDIEYQAPNVVIAQRWIDDQRMRYSAGAAEMTMSLTYHYNIPKPMMGLLKALYDTMQASTKPSELTFECWLEQYWTGPTTNIADLSQENRILSVYERAVDVVGWFDFYNTPEGPTRSSDNIGAYTTNFSFICRYSRPTHLRIKYPFLMNNCVIPKLYHPNAPYANYQSVSHKTTKLRSSLNYEELEKNKRATHYIQHPDNDDWQPLSDIPNRALLFCGLIVVCENEPKVLMNLESLGRFRFNPYWLEFIKILGDLVIENNSFLDIRLYRNGLETRFKLSINKDTMNLEADRVLDIEGYYHVAIYFNTHMASIRRELWRSLKRFPKVFYDICTFYGGCQFEYEELPLIGEGRPRDEPGEGSTHYTTYERVDMDGNLEPWPDVVWPPNYVPPPRDSIEFEGYIKEDIVLDLMEHQDEKIYRPNPVASIVKLDIINSWR